jgi:hypothetical protein
MVGQRKQLDHSTPQIASERRLFISGLHSSVTPLDIFSRFESFGQIVEGAEGVTKLDLDANGEFALTLFV